MRVHVSRWFCEGPADGAETSRNKGQMSSTERHETTEEDREDTGGSAPDKQEVTTPPTKFVSAARGAVEPITGQTLCQRSEVRGQAESCTSGKVLSYTHQWKQ